MSNLSYFLAENIEKEKVVKYVATKRIKDENGHPVEWELGCITSDEDEILRKKCTKNVQVPGKKNIFRPETDYDKYLGLLAVQCVKYPDLNDAGVQNSFKIMGADTLLKTMLKPGEYQDLLKKIQEINGFDTGMDELVEEAKN
ncbi:phage tail assembly chaperone [Clostridium neonatale]|uniref:phage tail assembly chaperone n=1 Tax=Clostridium neonatale TaxID=137838 RepID=UPI00374F857A